MFNTLTQQHVLHIICLSKALGNDKDIKRNYKDQYNGK